MNAPDEIINRWYSIRLRDRNRVDSGRPLPNSLSFPHALFGLLSPNAVRDDRGNVKCLACQTYYATWKAARMHVCPHEAEYREYTGRYKRPSRPTVTVTELTAQVNQLRQENVKLWENQQRRSLWARLLRR